MEIAGYSYTWGPITGPRDIDHRQVIRWFREQGIRSIELYDPWIQDSDASEVQCIIDALGEHDMQPCVCDVECHVVSRDADQRKAGTERFHQRLAVMHQMGVPIALILPFIPAWETDFRAEECHEWLNVALEQSLPVARELGITVMIANLGFRGDIYGQADWVVETCEHFKPEVKMVYDVGNFVMAGEDPVKALDQVYPYMIHVHLKDWVILPDEQPGASWLGHDKQWFQGCRFGAGIVPLAAAVHRLKALGYDGLVSPEYEGPDDPFEIMGQAIGYSRNLLG